MKLDTCPHCAKPLKPSLRSSPQHRRLFGVIKAAFDTWPEDCEFQPDNPEHLRAWLICKAGAEWRESTVIKVGPETSTTFIAMAIEAAMRVAAAEGVFSFVAPGDESVFVIRPRSIKFTRMDHLAFCRLSNDIDDVLTSVGLEPELLKKESDNEPVPARRQKGALAAAAG